METEGFEWDDDKCRRNIEKHGIDSEDAVDLFYGPHITRRSDRKKEERWLAVGEVEGRIIAVAFAPRDGRVRIISARRARKNEKRAYNQEKMGRAAEG